MFKNYLKLAIKVLGRRKFFTFVSLFGISFTLMVLMVIMAFLDTELGANAPMSEADRMLLVDRIEFKTQYYDTIYQVDSNLVAGVMEYDTVNYETEESGSSNSTSSLGYYAFREHLADVEPMERHTVMFGRDFDVFQDGRKYTMEAKYVDEEYWNILDFTFEEGGPFGKAEVDAAKSVIVVTDRLANEFFGTSEQVVGREIPLSGRNYEVVGMVKRTRSSSQYSRSDIYMPITTADERMIGGTELQGPFRAIYLAPSQAEVANLQDDLHFKGTQIDIPADMSHFETVKIKAFTVEQRYAWGMFRGGDDIKKSLRDFRLVLFGMLGFFILIPTLNLINLNLSRMMERASEIGVRKSFGADNKHILTQFLFENIIITLIGGIIGFVLSLLVLYLINQSGALPDSILAFNWRVFMYSLVICLGFGVLSGLIPAWRMSRMHIVKGLNN